MSTKRVWSSPKLEPTARAQSWSFPQSVPHCPGFSRDTLSTQRHPGGKWRMWEGLDAPRTLWARVWSNELVFRSAIIIIIFKSSWFEEPKPLKPTRLPSAIPYSSPPEAWVTRSRHGPQLSFPPRAKYLCCIPDLHVILTFFISLDSALLQLKNATFLWPFNKETLGLEIGVYSSHYTSYSQSILQAFTDWFSPSF